MEHGCYDNRAWSLMKCFRVIKLNVAHFKYLKALDITDTAQELGDFLGHYKRETELFTVFREGNVLFHLFCLSCFIIRFSESGMIPRHIFEEFVAFASDSGLSD